MSTPLHASPARVAAAVTALLLAFGTSAVLLAEALPILRAPAPELTRRFSGATFEDVFGFGFWLTWAGFATVLVASAGLVWLSSPNRQLRGLALAAVVAFAAASVVDHQAYSKLLRLWQGHIATK